jgi:hypothetical protein
MLRVTSACLVLLLFYPLRGPAADAGTAASAYEQGFLLEKKGNYAAARDEFGLMQPGDPFYVNSRRELGNCYYYLGEKSKALPYYDAYLAARPDDTRFAAFVENLRKSLPAAPAEAAASVVAAEPFKIRYSLRGSLGYGMALSSDGFGYGRFDNFTTTVCSNCFYLESGVGEDVHTDKGYPAAPGAGLAYSFEALALLIPQVEVGIGAFPLSLDSQASSSATFNGGYFRSDSSHTRFQTLPFIATVYGKIPMGFPRLSLVLGLGMGYAPGGTLKLHSDYVDNSSGSSVPITRDMAKSLSGALAYRGVLGMEYALNRNFSLSLGLQLVAAQLSASQDVTTESYLFAGSDVRNTTTISYVDSPPDSGPVTHTGPSFANPSVETWDDGRTKEVRTSTFDPFTGKTSFTREVTTKQKKGLAANDLSIQQFAPMFAVTWSY